MRLSNLLILSTLVALGACGTATDSASYTPPDTPGGRLCTHQCSEAQDYCRQSCGMDQRQCTTAQQAQALRDYDSYTIDQFRLHQQIELLPRDFEHTNQCTEDHEDCTSICERRFQTCYENCGGTVHVESSCQFLCF